MKLFKAVATIGGLTGASRIMGFVRDILTAAILGAGPIADAFFVALKLPNLFRRVTAEGAFSVAFVPLYSATIEEEGQARAARFAANSFSLMIMILTPFTLLALLVMPWIVSAVAPGFIDDPERFDLTVELARLTFPYMLLISLTALLGGVLNAHEKFAPFAGAPILFNLAIIVALLTLPDFVPTAGHAMAIGVLAAGFAQLILLFAFTYKYGVRVSLKVPEVTPKIRKLFRLMGPGLLGAGAMHLNLFADLIIASMLAEGAISYLYYADRLNQLPLGIIGIAIGTALLPLLSKAMAGDNKKQSNHLFNRALEVSLLLSLPAAAALIAIAGPLIGGLFERGAFSAADTLITAQVLAAYSIGLPAYVAGKVLSTAYWSGHDTMGPVKVTLIVAVANVALGLALSTQIGVVGLALATGLVGWLHLFLLAYGLKKKSYFGYETLFKKRTAKMVLSAGIMAGALWLGAEVLRGGSIIGFTEGAALLPSDLYALLILVPVGGIVYGASVILTGAVDLSEMRRIVLKK